MTLNNCKNEPDCTAVQMRRPEGFEEKCAEWGWDPETATVFRYHYFTAPRDYEEAERASEVDDCGVSWDDYEKRCAALGFGPYDDLSMYYLYFYEKCEELGMSPFDAPLGDLEQPSQFFDNCAACKLLGLDPTRITTNDLRDLIFCGGLPRATRKALSKVW
ncbi:hypothetical protein ACFL3T_02025 [Patescibacteria group bacterium]